MSSALPRPGRPVTGPPSTVLPELPVVKTRRSVISAHSDNRVSPGSPKKGRPMPQDNPTSGASPALSTASFQARTASGSLSTSRTVRKTVSINSFPQPPRGDNRVSSLPPSPLSSNVRKIKPSPSSGYQAAGGTPSLLNGTAEGKSVGRLAGTRNSDGLISVSSPTPSRSSSAQDSYSTTATQYEDLVDMAQQKLDACNKRASKTDTKGNVLVSVRVRPDAGAHSNKADDEWLVDGKHSVVAYSGKEGGDYLYDNVFTAHDDNSRVYDHIAKRLVRRVMEGYHGTVFAYGMTGTGKTFSMQGTATSPGVIPLAITDIFSYIRETPSREFLLRVSYLEIYNEKIHDLLSMPTTNALGIQQAHEEIKLREDSKRGVYASPLKEEIVQSPTQLLRVIARGDQARRTASTQFNARSSRSHAVVQIVVESRERLPSGLGDSKRAGLPPGGVRVSTLSLIDLAGSEKAAECKERRQEGSHINKSLLTLGTVISKLSEHKEKDGKATDKDGKHLPYRDSKLTRLLQGALSGNSLVSILCTVQLCSPSNTATTETLNTLKFASRAKNNIVSHARRAEEALGGGGEGGARVLLERYRMEILELRKQLETQGKGRTDSFSDDEREREKDAEEERAREREAEQRHEEQMLEIQLARTALKERIDHLNRLILSSKSIGVNASGSYSALSIHTRFSQASIRSSVATSTSGKPYLERTPSVKSMSTIGRRSSAKRSSEEMDVAGTPSTLHDEDATGEFGDGTASLAAQNQALQTDLVDKTRYIQTLEKRLLYARRASSTRTPIGNKQIMVGEDHSVAVLLKEKDSEIAELRARLDDKDKMLTALRSAARSRDHAERLDSRAESCPPYPDRTRSLTSSPPTTFLIRTRSQRQGQPVDEMSRMLDEMIQDKVDKGQLSRSERGSVRMPVRESNLYPAETQCPPIQLKLLSRDRSGFMNEPTKPVILEAS